MLHSLVDSAELFFEEKNRKKFFKNLHISKEVPTFAPVKQKEMAA